uniref:V-type proton ATPase subunit E n=1 Tax=Hirondellea gigas TaxID=1518452 RepID=A0A6A7G3C0_9CRUS
MSTKMDSETARAQIQQMVEFIKQEAREKADELEVKTEAEFNIEKLRLIEEHKRRIRDEFKDKEKELATRRKIEYSSKVNEMRMKTITTREEAVSKIKADTLNILHGISSKDQYKDLLCALIIQGLIRLREPEVRVRCRKEDEHLVSGLLSNATGEYTKQMKKDVGGKVEWKTRLTLDTTNYLPPNKKLAGAGVSCAGGVILSGDRGRIVVDQTIDQRLSLCYEQLKPAIRAIMFPEN